MLSLRSTLTSLLALAMLGCSTPPANNPEAGTPTDSSTPPRDGGGGGSDASTLPDPEPEPDNDEGAAEDEPLAEQQESGGMDDVGRCAIPRTQTEMTSMLPATSCVDYDMGYMDGAAQTHCTGAGGTWVDGQRCSTTPVASCRFEEMGQVRIVRMFQASRGTPLTPAQVQTWCMGAGGAYEGPAVPTNTGRCRLNPSPLISEAMGVRHCVNYDLGFTEAGAMSEASRDCPMAMFEPYEQCAATALVAGCRTVAEGRTKTTWFYITSRSSTLTEAQVQAYCEGVGGTYLDNMNPM
jgi:hypothetical protein